MEIQRFYLGCLAHASYLIWSRGEAAVVDPQRDVEIYLEAARKEGLEIRWIIETHLHADFVSGHVELAGRTGATICIGAGSGAGFPHRELKDGETVALGDGQLKVLATPGHTTESICIAATDPGRGSEPFAVITGDTLFIGDVGRPDLSPHHTPQELAGMLYDSLHDKLLALPDTVLVYPAHGAGSLCGRQMSAEAVSTIGRERASNYALQAKTREQFVDLLTGDLPPRPAYFSGEVERNRSGAAWLAEWKPLAGLTPAEVEARMGERAAVLLDTRPAMQFASGHIPGSVHVGLGGQFASWAARVLGLDARLMLVAEDAGAANEARMRLARVGIENVEGWLAGGIGGWAAAGKDLIDVPQYSVQELAERRRDQPSETHVLDVREAAEREAGYLDGSVNIPLGQLPARLSELDGGGTWFVHCKGGYRSSIAVSLMMRQGFENAGNVMGGFDAWKTAFPDVR